MNNKWKLQINCCDDYQLYEKVIWAQDVGKNENRKKGVKKEKENEEDCKCFIRPQCLELLGTINVYIHKKKTDFFDFLLFMKYVNKIKKHWKKITRFFSLKLSTLHK